MIDYKLLAADLRFSVQFTEMGMTPLSEDQALAIVTALEEASGLADRVKELEAENKFLRKVNGKPPVFLYEDGEWYVDESNFPDVFQAYMNSFVDILPAGQYDNGLKYKMNELGRQALKEGEQ